MASNKKPRKAYRPKPVNHHAHLVAMAGATFVDSGEISRRGANLSASVDAACQGRGTKDHWRTIFDAVNTLEAMIELKLAAGAGVDHVMFMMDDVLTRSEKTGSAALKHDERDLLRNLARVYSECLIQLTNAELYRVETHVSTTIRQALRGKPKTGHRVIDANALGVAA
jgi:hypothetical protein